MRASSIRVMPVNAFARRRGFAPLENRNLAVVIGGTLNDLEAWTTPPAPLHARRDFTGKGRFADAGFHNSMRAKKPSRRPEPGRFLFQGETPYE
jgi:hypothetical protein